MSLRTLSSSNQGCCLAIDGEMTIYTAAELKAGLVAHAAPEMEIDLSGVTDLDTAGLQLMLMVKRMDGARVRFVNHAEVVVDCLELANLAGALGDPLVIAAANRREEGMK